MRVAPVAVEAHEQVVRVSDPASGLIGFIALHSTARGPAAGGLRMRPYGSEAEALQDVLRLSRGMTLKNAAADLPLGGGKAVIIGDPAMKSDAMLRAMGRAVDLLGGRYWTAEDMGMSPADMAVLREVTPYVAGLADGPWASGDPSPVTAQGVFHAVKAVARHRFGAEDLAGRSVAVQGLGHVGWHLCALLREAGAELTVSDIDADRVAEAQRVFWALAVEPEDVLTVEADILAPCAIGGVLNEGTIRALRVGAVAGAANNQLAAPEDGDRLHGRGILYAPDFVANGGGIINVAAEILQISEREAWVERKLSALSETMEAVLARAAALDVSPNAVAEELVSGGLGARAA